MAQFSNKRYSYGFLIPAGLIYFIMFLLPAVISCFFSLTRWTFVDWEFIGFKNFEMFFTERSLNIGFKNTLVYAVSTCVGKTVLGLLLAVFLCSDIKTKSFLRSMVFFPVIISTIAVGVTFQSMLNPTTGIINKGLELIGIQGPNWLGDKVLALYSVALVDIWKGVGMATVIYIAGITSISKQYYEALYIDGGSKLAAFWHITLPLSKAARNSVITLSFIGGLRSFDLIWTITKGGPGFSTDVISSIIYKQYSAGFYGISTAGNVLLFLGVSLLAFPLYRILSRNEVDL